MVVVPIGGQLRNNWLRSYVKQRNLLQPSSPKIWILRNVDLDLTLEQFCILYRQESVIHLHPKYTLFGKIKSRHL